MRCVCFRSIRRVVATFNNAHNKSFKRDLARVAFLVCVGFSVYGALQMLLYCVPAPLNAALAFLPNSATYFIVLHSSHWFCCISTIDK